MNFIYLKSLIPAALFLLATPQESIVAYVGSLNNAEAVYQVEQDRINNLHADWDALLKKYVNSNGDVNYTAFKNDPKFDGYLATLSNNYPHKSWKRNQALSYWLNAYNAFTVKLVCDNYPLKSIKDIGNPWDKKFIKLDGKTFSLNQIENEIIRPIFGDARIHFAINCASASCPPLLNKAFTSSNVTSEMEKLTRTFMNSSKYNTLSASSIQISPIFEWYKADFTKNGSVVDFINKYSSVVVNADATMSYTNYDWSLNSQ